VHPQPLLHLIKEANLNAFNKGPNKITVKSSVQRKALKIRVKCSEEALKKFTKVEPKHKLSPKVVRPQSPTLIGGGG
jgi:hypothetical protein